MPSLRYLTACLFFQTSTLNNSLQNVEDTVDQLMFYTDIEYSQANSLIKLLEKFSKDGSYTSYDIQQASQYCTSTFQNQMLTHSVIQGIYVITPSSLILGTSSSASSSINYSHNCLDDDWYRKTYDSQGAYYVTRDLQCTLFSDSHPSVYIARSVWNIYSHKYLGVILLDCDASLLDLDDQNLLPDLSCITVKNTETDEILYSNRAEETAETQYTSDRQSVQLALKPLELDVRFNYTPLYQKLNPAISLIAVICIILIIQTLITLHFTTRNLIRPIETLTRAMVHQHSTALTFTSPYMLRNDEIGTLYNEYANMMDKLNSQIKNDYQNKLILLDSQMKSLEARINSHFLFNTLESINSMAELSDNTEIATMSLALGSMFRYSIKTKSELVTLHDELQHVDDYNSIQQIRFSHRYSLILDIPSKLLQQKVLKLILQPLVENALYHGLNYCTVGSEIRISAVSENQDLLISVSDDGVGMEEDVLQELRCKLQEEPSFTELGHRTEQSIGLKNIHSRIRLYYGDGYGLSVESKKGTGTKITIRIPVIPEAEPSPANDQKKPSAELEENRS